MADGRSGSVVREGEVPFAVLEDRRIVMARFRTTFAPQPLPSLSDPEATHWALTLDGREFAVIGAKDGQPGWVPLEESWARGGMTPHSAVADGGCHIVRYDFFLTHHLGWLSGPVTLAFDVAAMTVTVSEDLTFDPD